MANSGTISVALPAIIDLDALDEVRDRLLQAMDAEVVTVSAAAVERVATNGLLMLLSAAETARQNGLGFSIDRPSASMAAAIERLGLKTQFEPIVRG